jgi:protocatechuate 3,4-dioxygenase beta subunit
MKNDDVQVGRILNRREVLALLGGSGLAVLAGCTTPAPSSPTGATTGTPAAAGLPSCVVRPALTEGPYFVDEKLNRADIRSDPTDGSVSQGAPLALTINVSRVTGGVCTALSAATVDVWHCDALGIYSDARDPGFNTVGKKFLRGYQTTDSAGRAQFTTIYPGWYQGRAVHIHFKIRTDPSAGAALELTSQLFFDETLTDEVHARPPYSQKGQRTLRNAGDGIYRNGGDRLLLQPTRSGDGYAAAFDIALTT